jgi:DNA-directed RNA polymerase specialized sigma24 family protein
MTENRIELDRVVTASLALQIAEREERTSDPADHRRTELILADAGLTLGEIAALTGRNYETVKAAIRRARAGRATKK